MSDGIDTRLLPGYRSPLDVPMPQQIQPDIGAFFKSKQEAEDRRRKQQREDEEMSMKKEKFLADIEAQKYMNRLRDVETKLAPTKLSIETGKLSLGKEKLKYDISESTTKELGEVRQFQESLMKLAQGTQSKETRKKLADIYNKHTLVQKYGMQAEEDQFGDIAFKSPSVAEREISKESGKFIGKIAQENSSVLPANANIDQSIQLIREMPDDYDTGYFAGIKKQVGTIMEGLGMDNTVVSEANDINSLSKSLNATTLTMLRPLLGAQFTEKEGERVKQTFGSIDDPKEVLVNSLTLMKAQNLQKLESNAMQTMMVQQNPDNLGTSSSVVAEIQNYPKFIYKEMDGQRQIITYYDFTEWYKRTKNPEASYIEIREAWADEWKENTGSDSYIGTKRLPNSIYNFLKSVDSSKVQLRGNQ